MDALVDSNVLIDVIQKDPSWFEWSARILETFGDTHRLLINPIVYAEVSISYKSIEHVDEIVSQDWVAREEIPYVAAFLAGKCFVEYRAKGGTRKSPLPDFFIGAHAAVRGIPLITRDEARFRTYFPTLEIISPSTTSSGGKGSGSGSPA